MEPIDNNQFEVVPTQKRKVAVPCPNVYLNPALDLLANEDPMCNTALEIIPNKKRKRSKSCDIIAFENSALDLGISKAAVNEFLAKELENVRKNVRYCSSEPSTSVCFRTSDDFMTKPPKFDTKMALIEPKIRSEAKTHELNSSLDITMPEKCLETSFDCSIGLETKTAVAEPTYANLTDIATQFNAPDEVKEDSNIFEIQIDKTDTHNNQNFETGNENMPIFPTPLNADTSVFQNCMDISKIENINDSGISILEQKSITTTNLENNDLSTINKTNIQTNITNQVFVNNPSNLSLSFIDRLALDSPNMTNQSLILDDDLNESNIMEIKTITIITKKKCVVVPDKKKNTNPFLDPELNKNLEESSNITAENPFLNTDETNTEMEYSEEVLNRPGQAPSVPINTLMPRRLFASDTNSTISTVNETIDHPEYENIDNYRPESPVYENVADIFESNFNKQSKILGCDVSQFNTVDVLNLNKAQANSSNESNESKKDRKYHILKVLKPKKMFKNLRKSFRSNKHNNTVDNNATLNPYEIPRKVPKDKSKSKDETGIENPALYLDTSDIEIEEIDEYDDDEEHQYETIKTLRNTRLNMNVTPLRERHIDNLDVSQNKTNTPSKKVRFDSTLNQEKVITGNSFDYGIQSPGFDVKIDKYHDELENCINERKFLEQNM